jgi:2-C-methyl-D-erythritol 2,4-cyclodiphosphate synthase
MIEMLRIGQGYDVHRLTSGRKLILGGVEIPFAKGLLGNSDADVLLHAISDALLGAAALGDIGEMFPDDTPEYKDADSIVLLKSVVSKLLCCQIKIINIDSTIVAQEPKMRPYISEMRKNIADACLMNIDQVSVKATTEEGLGFTGRREGMSAWAICMIDFY